jgi:hypothetical protein
LWTVSSTAAQTSGAERYVRFDLGQDLGATSAAPGGSPGPSGQHLGGDDPFIASPTTQPFNQVSIYYFKFYNIFLTTLIQEGFRSPRSENFDLDNGSDGFHGGGTGPDSPPVPNPGPSTPTRQPRKAQKSGSRLASSGDDVLRFFQVVEGKKQCKFCL